MKNIAWVFGVALLLVACGCGAAQPNRTRVLKVADGDTFVIDGSRVRLFGIDAPEYDQPFGPESTRALRDLIEGKIVEIESTATDDYGRIVAKVRLGDMDVNGEMIRGGHAWVFQRFSRNRVWLALERDAKAAQVGLWAGPAMPPWEWRELRPTHADRECRIKGNINSRGAKIYHVPGSAHYAKTRISASKGERWFCDASEARAAGWRQARPR